LEVEDLCTHRLPPDEAPHGYEVFQKEDGAIKVMLEPLTLGLGHTVDR
jgi:threonine dehydrogenase-like Zn-dependent dehydrogenase